MSFLPGHFPAPGALKPPPVLTFLTSSNLSITGTTSTHSSLNIGPASADRDVIALITWGSSSSGTITSARTLSSCTIGGVAAQIHVQASSFHSFAGYGAAIVSARIPAGTTATIVTNFTSSQTVNSEIGVFVYSMTGHATGVPNSVGTDLTKDASGDWSTNLNVLGNGCCLFGVGGDGEDGTETWLDGTPFDNAIFSGVLWATCGHISSMAAQTKTVTYSMASSTTNDNALVAATWGN